jgi:hypothetical protein
MFWRFCIKFSSARPPVLCPCYRYKRVHLQTIAVKVRYQKVSRGLILLLMAGVAATYVVCLS